MDVVCTNNWNSTNKLICDYEYNYITIYQIKSIKCSLMKDLHDFGNGISPNLIIIM